MEHGGGRRARALVGGVAVLAAAVVVPATRAGGQTGPSAAPVITVTPATGLEVGDTVRVTGAGFPPQGLAAPVEVALCSAAPVEDLEPGLIDPDRVGPYCAGGVSRYAEADGTFAVDLPVTTARAPIVWAGTSAVSAPGMLDFHARVATAPVEVAAPAGDRVAVRVEPAERYAGHGVTVWAIYQGALPEAGSVQLAECGAAVLDAPADPAVVAGACDGGSVSAPTPDAVGEIVARVPASAGTGAVWAGGRSSAGSMVGGAAPLTVHDPHVTVTPSSDLVEAQVVRVQADELHLATDPIQPGWKVFQCARSIVDDLPAAYLHHSHCGPAAVTADADADGRLEVEHTVRRYIVVARGTTIQRTVDCAETPGACVLLVAGQLPGDAREVGFAAPLSLAPAPPVVVALHAGAVTEGDAGTVTGHVPVTLNRPVGHAVTVAYRTFDNAFVPWAARAGEDYLPAEGTVTLAPGETAASIPVPVVGDTRAEPGEMALVGIGEATGATVGGYGGIGGVQITDDD